MDLNRMVETAGPLVVAFGLKVIGAIVVFVVGRWLIGMASGVVTRLMERQHVDPTLTR